MAETDADRARRLASAIEAAAESGAIQVRGGCASCDPGACPECGCLFTGAIYQISHPLLGRRNLTDRAVHYLGHGISRYTTAYLVRGEPVEVRLDLDGLERFLDLKGTHLTT
jgi:hypothetical protein